MKYEIIIYTDARGRAPLRDYLKELKSQKDNDSRIRASKIQDYISLLQEKGTMLPKPICKHFSDKKHSWLWELRPGGDRVLFCLDWWCICTPACIQEAKPEDT